MNRMPPVQRRKELYYMKRITHRRLKKKIRDAIKITLIGVVGAVLMVSMWIGSVIQESEKLCPVIAAEVQE